MARAVSTVVLRDDDGWLWTLTVDETGLLTTSRGGQSPTIHALLSPDGTSWRLAIDRFGMLSSLNDGVAADRVAAMLRAPDDTVWTLTIGNDGILVTTLTALRTRPMYYCRQHNTVFLKSDYGVGHPCAPRA